MLASWQGFVLAERMPAHQHLQQFLLGHAAMSFFWMEIRISIQKFFCCMEREQLTVDY